MKKSWNMETYDIFTKMSELTLGKKAGDMGKWGA